MGQATRTTKLPLDLGNRTQGGTNTGKRAYLQATAWILDAARAFYVAFFLAHRQISADKVLTWAEFQTVETKEHPHPLPDWNFSRAFPNFPFVYRRAVIKDAIGKVKSYLSNLSNWRASGKKKGKPGVPGASNHPVLYEGAFSLEVEAPDVQHHFVRLKVYTGERWRWANYPVKSSRYFEQRTADKAWEQQSPKLILRRKSAALHFAQTKEIKASKVRAWLWISM